MPAPVSFIPDHYQINYRNVWEHAYQQKMATLRRCVDVDSNASGKVVTGPIIDAFEMADDLTRGGDTQLSDIGSDAWNVYPAPAYHAAEIARWDAAYLDKLTAPDSEIAQGQAYAWVRKLDSRIVTAATGNARRGENGETIVALPSSQIIATTWNGPGGSPALAGPLNWYKINQAAYLLNAAEVPREDRFFWLDAENLRSLVDDIIANHSGEVSSIKDMTPTWLLNNGLLDFNFVLSERLERDSNDITTCVAHHKSAIQLGVWGDRNTTIERVITRKNALWIYTDGNAGATRKRDLGVVSVLCNMS